jgi:hypothetical protein
MVTSGFYRRDKPLKIFQFADFQDLPLSPETTNLFQFFEQFHPKPQVFFELANTAMAALPIVWPAV